MVFALVLLKLAKWLLYKLLANSCFKATMKVKNNTPQRSPPHHHYPHLNKFSPSSHTLVCDINGTLLRSSQSSSSSSSSSPSFFPYFMLVAFEGGTIFRALLLLLSYPFLLLLPFELQQKVMIFITFCGLKAKAMESVERGVLPKFYLEDLNYHVYQVFASSKSRMVFTSVPRVMVEGFLKEYLDVEKVVGTELQIVGDYFSGFVANSGVVVKHRALKEFIGEKKLDIVGIGTSSFHDHLFISLCKEAYVVNKEDMKTNGISSVMPREKYPKPLVFHDGRLAFLPTPLSTLAMFMWLPLGFFLAVFRLSVGIVLPYKLAILLGCFSGVRLLVRAKVKEGESFPHKIPLPSPPPSSSSSGSRVLYVCTHRTLLDPVFLSTALGKPLTAVTYSLSKMSEIIAPIKTVRLTRNRVQDSETMQRLLKEGDLVICPEGTTCREPYLLRFSSLFAELADEIVPVAMNTQVGMFYGTTASGLKCLDPIFFMMNPKPCYTVEILQKLPKELTCSGGKTSHEVANYIQRLLGEALGFQCTNLTRRDKYLMLAGNEGLVKEKERKKQDK